MGVQLCALLVQVSPASALHNASVLALSLYAALSLGSGPTLGILFMGNSHTMVNDVPGLVRGMVQAAPNSPSVVTQTVGGGLLNDIYTSGAFRTALNSRKWDFVVLQGAAMSSSHRYVYSNEGAIQLARTCLQSGAKVLLFPEWPRRGWKETDYILGIYRLIQQRAKGVGIVPVPQAFDLALLTKPTPDFWAPDGNHAALSGSYLAAGVIAFRIAGASHDLPFTPGGLGESFAESLRNLARRAVDDDRSNGPGSNSRS